MQGVKSIQTKLANLMIRLDDKGQHHDELTKTQKPLKENGKRKNHGVI